MILKYKVVGKGGRIVVDDFCIRIGISLKYSILYIFILC